MCTEGLNVLPLAIGGGEIIKKAAYTQWPHPFASQQPVVMGYSVRTANARYTEWIYMEYAENGTHIPNWGHRCSREYYNHSADPNETVNVAEDPAQTLEVARHAAILRLGWRAAAGASAWPALPPNPVSPTVSVACPFNKPNPPPPKPGPPVPPTVTAGASRQCINGTAQGNASDTSCWCRPARTPIGSYNHNWSDCERLCTADTNCRAWTFSSKAGCFRHSTAATRAVPHPGPSGYGIWSGCAHPVICPGKA